MSILSGSWKTTGAGISAILIALVHVGFCIASHNLTETDIVGALAAISSGIGLLSARDNDKSSEQVGAGNTGTTIK